MRTIYNYNVMWYTREVVLACIRKCLGMYDSFCLVPHTQDSALINAITTLGYNTGEISGCDLYASVMLGNKIEINVFKSRVDACYIYFGLFGADVCVKVNRAEARTVLLNLLQSLGKVYVG